METLLKKVIVTLGIIWCSISITSAVYAKQENVIETAADGIVEVQSGFLDAEGNFRRMQNGSGFLISNAEGSTYIITNASIVENSSKARKAYCKKHSIKTDNSVPGNMVRIVVKGDVAVEASVLAKSEEKDFCILSTENVVNEKSSLRLGDSLTVKTGDKIYTLGFPTQIKNLEFAAGEVEITEGTVEDSQTDEDYILHSAVIADGNVGGPVIDEAGYVIGINCPISDNVDSSVSRALSINEIIEVLDNFSIYYESRTRDEINSKLQNLYQECEQVIEEGGYKSESIEELQAAMASVKSLSEEKIPTIEELNDVYMSLTKAKGTLIPKTEKIRIVIYVLAIVDLILLIWFIVLLILKKKSKSNQPTCNPQIKQKKSKKEKQRRRQGAYQQTVQNPYEQPLWGEPPVIQSENISSDVSLCLRCERNNKVVKIEKETYNIGKKAEMVDFCISDNSAISRKHAMITRKDGVFYLEDLGSSNGTFLNGQVVLSGRAVRIKPGDIIVLADEKFIVEG